MADPSNIIRQKPPDATEKTNFKRAIPEVSGGTVQITGNELGEYENIDDLRRKARKYATENFGNKYVVVKSTNEEILINQKGIKHGTASRSISKIKAIVALPEHL